MLELSSVAKRVVDGELKLRFEYKEIGSMEKQTVFCPYSSRIEVPDGVEFIRSLAFSNLDFIEEVILPASIKGIGSYAFRKCSKLSKINIPDQDKVVFGENVFTGCDQLVDEKGMIIFGDTLFYCVSKGGEILIPSNVTSVESEAFCSVSGDTVIYIPGSVKNADKLCGNIIIPLQTEICPIDSSDVTSYTFINEKGEIAARVYNPEINQALTFRDGEFDFALYDDMFSIQPDGELKAVIATNRLAYDYRLGSSAYEDYMDYLCMNSYYGLTKAIDENDVDLLNKIIKLNIISLNDCEMLLEYASDRGEVEIVSMLMQYKMDNFT